MRDLLIKFLLREKTPNYQIWQQVLENSQKEKRPIIALAPMADVTDVVFREMIAKYSRVGKVGGGPDLMWTEFVSCDGLCSLGREVLKRDLEYTEDQRPIIAQLFTSKPKNMYEAVKLCKEMGFDGVDINMGCPVDVIGQQGAGAKLITTPELAREIIYAAKDAAGEMPVSVKTRIGYHKIEYKSWLKNILDCNVAALTVHLRTKKEMSLVPAHWELASEIGDFIKDNSPKTIYLANGDVKDIWDAKEKYQKYKIDGVMIGRGVFGKPWLFDWKEKYKPKDIKENLKIMLEHTKMYEEKLGDIKNFAIMKKHYKAYVNGFNGAKELREKLFACQNYQEVLKYTNEFLSQI